MKKKAMLSCLLIVYSAMVLISGCGGGGGDSTPTTVTSQPVAVVKLSTSGTLSNGTLIGGIDTTVALPAGVSVKSTVNPPETDTGVVNASGAAAGSIIVAVYSAATSTLPGRVRILVINANGFGTGEFVTVNCDFAAGHPPAANGFSLTNFNAISLNTSTISGLTPGLTVDIK